MFFEVIYHDIRLSFSFPPLSICSSSMSASMQDTYVDGLPRLSFRTKRVRSYRLFSGVEKLFLITLMSPSKIYETC